MDPSADPVSRVVLNARPAVDWNTCGQAAVATLLAHWRLGPFVPGVPVADGDAIDYVRAAFPPDVPLGLGTSAMRIAAALRAHGLTVEHIHSGWFERRTGLALERVVAHVAAGHPVPVCVDYRLLGGPVGTAHWAIVLAFEGDRVRLGNVTSRGASETQELGRFLEMWRCRMLPYGHNHAAVLARP